MYLLEQAVLHYVPIYLSAGASVYVTWSWGNRTGLGTAMEFTYVSLITYR